MWVGYMREIVMHHPNEETHTFAPPHRETNQLKLLIVDDHRLVGDLVASALREKYSFDTKWVESLEEATSLLAEGEDFDVVLLDYQVRGVDGVNSIKQFVEQFSGKVVLFSGTAGRAVVERAIECGVRGFIPKTASIKTMGHAINFIADGEVFVPTDFLIGNGLVDSSNELLKSNEMTVLKLLCRGFPNKEIGRELGMEETTVKMHVKSVCRKLNASNRTKAVLEAMRLGLC